MKIQFSKHFIKQSKKLRLNERKKIHARIFLFSKDPFHPLLHNHSLTGKYHGYRSINITGDLHALYLVHEDEVIFDHVGTHSQLYG